MDMVEDGGDILSRLRKVDENEKQIILQMLKDPSLASPFNQMQILSKIPQKVGANSRP
jgi:hypothetical protein